MNVWARISFHLRPLAHSLILYIVSIPSNLLFCPGILMVIGSLCLPLFTDHHTIENHSKFICGILIMLHTSVSQFHAWVIDSTL